VVRHQPRRHRPRRPRGDQECHGVVAYEIATGEIEGFRANDGVILATGGPGQAFDHTTNAIANTGDGAAMAYRAGAPMEDMEMIQFHPTTLPSTGVLISEGASAARVESSTTTSASV